MIALETTAADSGKRLDSFLHERLPAYSRSRLQQWIKNGLVTVVGKPARSSLILTAGLHLAVTEGPAPSLRAEPENIPLSILYEDHDVIVVDKPAGMLVHAGAGQWRGTLVNALLYRFGSLSETAGALRPGIVHRLDRETSGVLVVARHDQAHASLASQFHARTVEKVYLALVEGQPHPPQASITAPIARDPVRRTRMTTHATHGARSALTHYRVIEVVASPATPGLATLLEVRIATGRTHQIRVHMASQRHPVVGDRLYGARAVPALGTRFFLHAHRLAFRSPSSGARLEFTSPLPPQLASYLAERRPHP